MRLGSNAAIAAGVQANDAPDAFIDDDPRYDARSVFDPDGYRLEVVSKSWQHL